MKTIQFRNGYASFQIPTHWEEEYEDEGAVNCYEDSDDAGNLRFNIITSSPPAHMKNVTVQDFMKAAGIPDTAEKISIDDNNIIAKHKDYEEDDGTVYAICYFEYVHHNPDGNFDLAIFTWTIEKELEAEIKNKECMAMIELSARELKFAR